MASPLISVVIPTFNRGGAILHTLKSLETQSLPSQSYEVLVVDSSNDDSVDILRRYEQAHDKPYDFRVIREERAGLHYAKNTGTIEARGEIVAVIEDDARADVNWLQTLVDAFDDPAVAAAGGRVEPLWFGQPPTWMEPFYVFLTLFSPGKETRPVQGECLVGCNIAVRRDILFKAGGYNPDLIKGRIIGDGEAGLQRKIFSRGLGKVMYVPAALVHHEVPQKRLTFEYMLSRMEAEGACVAHMIFQEKKPEATGLLTLAAEKAWKGVYRYWLSWRAEAESHAYYDNRFRSASYFRESAYYLKLVTDTNFREFAAREDWMKGEAGGGAK
ncbi:MAG: glycosyltransferase [Desulfovibrio sp.]|uniref:glycosyltransferase n=1 Tax=Desulfovibrio sp. 7SRBS1 TaxID=3378064 RepID=UPI003B42513A